MMGQWRLAHEKEFKAIFHPVIGSNGIGASLSERSKRAQDDRDRI